MSEKIKILNLETERPKNQFEIKPDKVIINYSGIPREIKKNPERGPHVPKEEKFNDFSIDYYSLEILDMIATDIDNDFNCYLIGEAATGKSMTVEFLANLCNREVYRMSLNGQTDVTDLIGRWIPNAKDLRVKIDNILKDPKRCKSAEARDIIESQIVKISSESKEEAERLGKNIPVYFGFTKEDMERVCELEGIVVEEGDWVWHDGKVPEAMKSGGWLVLDEINTCEPQILVRLNAVLEKGGRLVLDENSGKVVEKHPDFRVFFTANPPGGRYKGRIPNSEDFLSRTSLHNLENLPKKIRAARLLLRQGITSKEILVPPKETSSEGKLLDLFEEEWIKDFIMKYADFSQKARDSVEKGELAKNYLQPINFDQRDDDRFMTMIERDMKKYPDKAQIVILNSLRHIFFGKLSKKEDKDVLETSLDLIQVDQPKIKAPKDTEKLSGDIGDEIAGILIDPDIPEDLKQALAGSL